MNWPWIVCSSGGCQLRNREVLEVLCAAVTLGLPEGSKQDREVKGIRARGTEGSRHTLHEGDRGVGVLAGLGATHDVDGAHAEGVDRVRLEVVHGVPALRRVGHDLLLEEVERGIVVGLHRAPSEGKQTSTFEKKIISRWFTYLHF